MSIGDFCKKRPCKICRKWFLPNPRLKDNQKTCGAPKCQREWHRKMCAQWNKNNGDYFKANYLQKKIETEESTLSVQPSTRLKTGLPLQYVQEVIGMKHVVIIEYLAQLLLRRFQEVLRRQPYVNTEQIGRLPPLAFSRGDGL